MTLPEFLVFGAVFGGAFGAVWTLGSKLKRAFSRVGLNGELDELRGRMEAIDQKIEARFADLTLMVDDALRRPVADHTASGDQEEAGRHPRQTDTDERP